MKVLLYGINYAPELTGTGKYTGEMANWLEEKGYDVRVITSPPYYPNWQVKYPYRSWKYKREILNKIDVIRCPLYVPRRPTTLKRLLHLVSFALTSFFPIAWSVFWRPECIICIAPTLFCVPNAKLLSKLSKASLLLHIQDYEVDAMMGLGMAKANRLSFFTRKFERWCLGAVDFVSTISNTMMLKAENKGVNKERIKFLPNWSELDKFTNIDEIQLHNYKLSLNIPDDKKVILYSGNIGEKQGLEIIVEVARNAAFEDCVFIIVGDGAGLQRLKELNEKAAMGNIYFYPLQPYDRLPQLLSIADCHLIIQRKGAADAVLPSKLTNVLAVGGNCVITAELDTELGHLCECYPGIAERVEPESATSLTKGILKVLSLSKPNEMAINYARENLDKNKILTRFFSEVNNKRF